VDLIEPMLGVTIAPTMIEASEKENVIPSRCSVLVDCRVPPGLGGEHVRRRVEELIGSESETGYGLQFEEDVVGNSSSLTGPLAQAIESFAEENDPGVALAPLVLSGFTDSHWFRKAFPECVAYGFFPQHAMTLYETAPLIHAPDERIAVDDLEFASSFYYTLPQKLLD
jgi:acetylornithine deacetylase/succinyl-diaminopimelate desuccinylase-like protein